MDSILPTVGIKIKQCFGHSRNLAFKRPCTKG